MQLGLEQLAHDPEGEVALERSTGRAEHPQAGFGRLGTQDAQQRRLALTGGRLQQRDRPARGTRRRELGPEAVELGPALEKGRAHARAHPRATRRREYC